MADRGKPKAGAQPVIRSLKLDNQAVGEPPVVHDDLNGKMDRDVFFVKDRNGLIRIEPQEILFLQSEGNYVELHMGSGRFVLRHSLVELLKLLPGHLMHQVNRSQAVNILHVEMIGKDLVHLGKHVFTLSSRYRELLVAQVHVITGR